MIKGPACSLLPDMLAHTLTPTCVAGYSSKPPQFVQTKHNAEHASPEVIKKNRVFLIIQNNMIFQPCG